MIRYYLMIAFVFILGWSILFVWIAVMLGYFHQIYLLLSVLFGVLLGIMYAKFELDLGE